MNETDLRTVLAERSAGHAPAVDAERLAGVRRRVARRRLRRRGTAVAGATLALVAIGGVAAARTDPAPPPAGPPAPTAAPDPTVDGFPQWDDAVRALASARITLPARTGRLTVTPTTLDLVVATSCPAPDRSVGLEIRVNGRPFSTATCGAGLSTTADGWRRLGVRVGRPSVLTFRAGGADDGTGGRLPMPATGAFGVAVGERVQPVDD
ncbi:hypothetical protein [Micromonospora mirobrigensis]|uniref:Uncharacterized protein n=1 Tax=Micromonospora mirobrigensis TaxID=262898 RepID=A0A1C5A1F0_9ACTN|nr:hypothetical protein [Micromonospora mirobrigensis]SCF38844.1 hypothetical protein GA0070564_107138 [Micromonospora mirobrigensis]